MKGITFHELQNSPTKRALEATIIEKNNLLNEVLNFKSQLTQKDAIVASLTSQAGEANSWKNYSNSAQSQIQNLNASLSQKNIEFNLLKTQKDQKELEAINLSRQVQELQKSNLEAKNLKEQFEKQKEITEVILQESKKLQKNLIEKTDKINELLNIIENNDKKNLELQNKLIAANTNLDFVDRFFDDMKQEKLELKQEKQELQKELKTYKKSLVKKHDLSISQSIEIEKLRQELLEMSKSKIDNFSEKDENSSHILEQLSIENFNDVQTTISQLVETQDITQYIGLAGDNFQENNI